MTVVHAHHMWLSQTATPVTSGLEAHAYLGILMSMAILDKFSCHNVIGGMCPLQLFLQSWTDLLKLQRNMPQQRQCASPESNRLRQQMTVGILAARTSIKVLHKQIQVQQQTSRAAQPHDADLWGFVCILGSAV